MDKEEVLRISRRENEGKDSEWEQSVASKASRVSKATGLALSVILVLLDDIFLHTRIVGMASWIMFFAMEAASDMVLYLSYKKKSKLIWSVIDIICVIGDLTALIILSTR